MTVIRDGRDMSDSQLLQAVALDRAVYPKNYWLDAETALGYLHACPEVYTYAADGDKLVGYLNMSCIDADSYFTLLGGRNNDLCIAPENLCRPLAGQENYLYFSSIVVAPEYRGRGIAKRLFARFGEKLVLLRNQEAYFTNIIADAVSPHGEKICQSLGMKFEKITQCSSKLFRYSMSAGEPNVALDHFIKNLCGGDDESII